MLRALPTEKEQSGAYVEGGPTTGEGIQGRGLPEGGATWGVVYLRGGAYLDGGDHSARHARQPPGHRAYAETELGHVRGARQRIGEPV